jgi:catechol 2,3-dioxygenase-like lactoylglutathione lyase family enzyme
MPRALKLGLMSAALVGFGVLWGSAQTLDKPASPFARQTIDFGIVCSNAEKSIAFYKDVLGCTQLEGFDAPGQFATDIGLTDGLSFHVDVMTLGSDESATKIKLMSFPTSPGARVDQRFIHSSYGIRYLTLFVTDLNASVAKAEAAGTKPIGKGAVPLPAGFPEGMGLATFRDPDGNFIELVGPLKK